MTPEQARELTVQASHALAGAGHVDMVWGHVAVRDPEGRGIWIKAPGWGLEEVTDERVQLVSFDGDLLVGEGKPHKECHIHLQAMLARSELGATVHTHARAAVSFAALDVPLLAISHDATIFGGEDVPRFRVTGNLITTAELGQALAATLGDAPGALLPKHGMIAVGTGVPAAVMHAVLLDRACHNQLVAQAAGPIRIHSDVEEAIAKRAECWSEDQLAAGWRYLLRNAP